jgi:hypothetical protein
MEGIAVHRFVFGKWMNLFIALLINTYRLLQITKSAAWY